MATAAAAPAKRWAREYETIYILRPDVDGDGAEKVVDRVKDVIKRLDGTLTKLDNWGKRRLAYPIEKNTRGIFVYLKYVGFGDLVAELERNLRLLDEVVRFQTVLLADTIDPASVAVDPEEVQYLHVEEEEEEAEDLELERARSLGMAPRPPREPRHDDLAASAGVTAAAPQSAEATPEAPQSAEASPAASQSAEAGPAAPQSAEATPAAPQAEQTEQADESAEVAPPVAEEPAAEPAEPAPEPEESKES
jgi:small subunit ribosomal protein S6